MQHIPLKDNFIVFTYSKTLQSLPVFWRDGIPVKFIYLFIYLLRNGKIPGPQERYKKKKVQIDLCMLKKHRKPQRALPGFGLAKVQVVNAVEVHVLCVPGEAGLPHAKVQVGCVYSLNGHTTVLLDYVQD